MIKKILLNYMDTISDSTKNNNYSNFMKGRKNEYIITKWKTQYNTSINLIKDIINKLDFVEDDSLEYNEIKCAATRTKFYYHSDLTKMNVKQIVLNSMLTILATYTGYSPKVAPKHKIRMVAVLSFLDLIHMRLTFSYQQEAGKVKMAYYKENLEYDHSLSKRLIIKEIMDDVWNPICSFKLCLHNHDCLIMENVEYETFSISFNNGFELETDIRETLKYDLVKDKIIGIISNQEIKETYKTTKSLIVS